MVEEKLVLFIIGVYLASAYPAATLLLKKCVLSIIPTEEEVDVHRNYLIYSLFKRSIKIPFDLLKKMFQLIQKLPGTLKIKNRITNSKKKNSNFNNFN